MCHLLPEDQRWTVLLHPKRYGESLWTFSSPILLNSKYFHQNKVSTLKEGRRPPVVDPLLVGQGTSTVIFRLYF